MNIRMVTFVALIGLIMFGSDGIAAQVPSNWVRFESAAKDLSISMPSGYLVHTESDKYSDRKSIYAFENGVNMVFSAADVSDAVGNLSRVKPEAKREPAIMDFRIGGFDGKYITYQKPDFQTTIFLARKNTSYRIEVSAASKDAEEVVRFLRSIVVGGQRLATGDSPDAASAEVTSLRSLKTSPAIADAIEQKTDRFAGKVSYEPLGAFRGCEPVLPARPAIVLGRVQADLNRGFPDVRQGGEIRFRLDLLKNGGVGDIIVYSDVDVRMLKTFAESAKKLKFMPALKDGVAVDSCYVARLTFGVEVSSSIITVK
ncbi:MAG: energy transducer TonB [Pyrinomonadaceae bacterium]|nr:energy transducer TonB [Pyrinomonadaceae bacterium]